MTGCMAGVLFYRGAVTTLKIRNGGYDLVEGCELHPLRPLREGVPFADFVQEKAGGDVTLHKNLKTAFFADIAAAHLDRGRKPRSFRPSGCMRVDYAARCPHPNRWNCCWRRSKPRPRRACAAGAAGPHRCGAADCAQTASNARRWGEGARPTLAQLRAVTEYTGGIGTESGGCIRSCGRGPSRPCRAFIAMCRKQTPAARICRGLRPRAPRATAVLFIHAPRKAGVVRRRTNLAYENASIDRWPRRWRFSDIWGAPIIVRQGTEGEAGRDAGIGRPPHLRGDGLSGCRSSAIPLHTTDAGAGDAEIAVSAFCRYRWKVPYG